MNIKRMVADSAVEFIQDGMIVGLGTGSTTYWAIQKLGEKVKEGMKIKAIATSKESESLARELKIPIIPFLDIGQIDITIDGADEVDSNLNLIKGGGGALLREKIVATASKKLIIIVDETKLVKQLGKFPLPVEVIPFGLKATKNTIENLGCKGEIRTTDGKNKYQTDNGNYIIDCNFGNIENPEEINQCINMIPGVVDNGLFIKLANRILVAYKNGEIDSIKRVDS